jgi:ribosomal protein S7
MFLYDSQIFTSLVGRLTRRGNRVLSENIVLAVCGRLQVELNKPIDEILSIVFSHVRPAMYLKPKVVSGVTHKIPFLIKEEKEITKGLQWIAKSILERKERSFEERVYKELLDTYNGVSLSTKKKDDLHKQVISSRSNLRFLRSGKKKRRFGARRRI